MIGKDELLDELLLKNESFFFWKTKENGIPLE